MSIRLSKALSELNIGLQTAVEFLEKRKDGDGEKFGPTSKLTDAQYSALVEAFKQDAAVRTEAEKLFQKKPKEKKHSSETKDSNNESLLASAGKQEYKPLGKIDLDSVGKPAAKQSGATKQDNTPQPKAAAVSQAKENKSEDKAPVAKTHAQHKTTEVKPAETAKAENLQQKLRRLISLQSLLLRLNQSMISLLSLLSQRLKSLSLSSQRLRKLLLPIRLLRMLVARCSSSRARKRCSILLR